MTDVPLIETAAAIGPWGVFAAIAFAALFNEELVCLGVGLLIASGQAGLESGLAGCLLGITVGSLVVWVAGRLAGQRALALEWVSRRVPADRLGDWLSRHGMTAAVASRFVPGSRTPLLFAAGALGRCGNRYVAWTLFAGAVWAPLLILGAALLGQEFVLPFLDYTRGWGLLTVPVAAVCWTAGKRGRHLLTRAGRERFAASMSRLWRWEFWPAWVFYLPLAPWYLLLAARYRSFTVWTAANPGIPAGGVVGESKADILANLPAEVVVPTVLVPTGTVGDRLRTIRTAVEERGWGFPLVLKPDAGQRGVGVRRAADFVDVEKYLDRNPDPVIVQPYHPGPFEAGVYYYRLPGEATGRIFSVAVKCFPAVVGNGRLTLEQLVRKHPRYQMQADVFLTRHEADRDRVLGKGERFELGMAGNHPQGTMFRDGSHLITPALERAIDEVARRFDGFHAGRFDLRYADVNEFKEGRGFAVVELNGVTAESSNAYDPTWSLARAYGTLVRQWRLLFRIGHLNRQAGVRPVSVGKLVRLVWDYYRNRRIDLAAD
jgi:membrane protein DedA with SNARE-associated domain